MSQRAFVIGHPVAHSRSPLIHRYWLNSLNLDGSYEAIDVAPADVPPFVERLRGGEFAGGNVTLPLKEALFAAVDESDAAATRIGAINTVIVEDGRLIGRNTDMTGFLASLDAAAGNWVGENAIVLGAGGAARAVVEGLVSRGVKKVSVLNRTPSRASLLASRYAKEVKAGLLMDFTQLSEAASLVVNTTSVGMGGTQFDKLTLKALPKTALVADLVYTPLETPLLRDARARGLKTVDGLEMLLQQAVPGFAAWFGKTPEVTPELRELVLNDLEGTR